MGLNLIWLTFLEEVIRTHVHSRETMWGCREDGRPSAHPAATLIWDSQPPGLGDGPFLLCESPACAPLLGALAEEPTWLSASVSLLTPFVMSHGEDRAEGNWVCAGANTSSGLQVEGGGADFHYLTPTLVDPPVGRGDYFRSTSCFCSIQKFGRIYALRFSLLKTDLSARSTFMNFISVFDS